MFFMHTGCPAAPTGYTLQAGTDLLTGMHTDMAALPWPSQTTPTAAGALCSSTPGCNGFVFTSMGATDGNAGMGVLKSSVVGTFSAPNRCLYSLQGERVLRVRTHILRAVCRPSFSFPQFWPGAVCRRRKVTTRAPADRRSLLAPRATPSVPLTTSAVPAAAFRATTA